MRYFFCVPLALGGVRGSPGWKWAGVRLRSHDIISQIEEKQSKHGNIHDALRSNLPRGRGKHIGLVVVPTVAMSVLGRSTNGKEGFGKESLDKATL